LEVALVTEPREMLVGERVHVRPVEGETAAVSVTVPMKPLNPETVMVEVPVVPDEMLTLVALAAKLKSWTV
jgi:hypothetical protein